jgi:diguanylate cyclase (GGDEF)-like protein
MLVLAAAGIVITAIFVVLFGVSLLSRLRPCSGAADAAANLSRRSEHGIVAAAVAFGTAACESVAALRSAIARAMCEAAPGADGVLIYEERDGVLVCVAAFGERFAYYAGATFALNDDTALPARAVVRDHHVRPGGGARALHPGDADAVAFPLSLGSGRRCAVAVAARSRLEDAAVARLTTLAEIASPAYRIVLEREDDRYRAEYDGLTSLLTSRAFRQRLSALIDRARIPPGEDLALLFVDTDNFKRWNDSYGHTAGDALLRELAQLLRSFAAPERDVVARNGGDEFCLVLRETGKAAAIERAEALRARITAADLAPLRPARAEHCVTITASIGVAVFPVDAVSASQLLELADAAMYHSKATGRDAVSYRGDSGTFLRFSRPPPASSTAALFGRRSGAAFGGAPRGGPHGRRNASTKRSRWSCEG